MLSVQADLPHSIRHRLALLLSELVTNAIQHGGAGPDGTVQVRVEVFDPGSNSGPPRDRLEEGGGYGLLLVDRLADGWGRGAAAGGGSLAWFELALADADRL